MEYAMDDVVRTTVDAYIRFLPRYYGELTMRGFTGASVPKAHPRAPLGQIGYRFELADHTFFFIVRINNDTIYGPGWFNLEKEPAVIKVPEVLEGRFWSIQIADRWTEIIPGVGSRRGSKPGAYAMVGPGWKGELPEGVERLDTYENKVFLAFRVGFFPFADAEETKADIEKAEGILRQFTVVPLSEYVKNGAPDQRPRSEDTPPPPVAPRTLTAVLADNRPLALLALIREAVSQPDCPLSKEEKKLLEQFSAHLDQAKGEFESSSSDQSTVAAMIQGLDLGRRLVDGRVRATKKGDNGWVTIPAGEWGERWLDRAAVAEYAIYANRPDSSLYPEAHADMLGLPLSGAYSYTLHFAEGQFPPVSNFWSITLYRGDTLTLVENAINRYSIGDRTPGLVYGPDGSLTIYIQKERPEGDKAANWLPCPEGEFNLMTRLYGPEKEAQDGTYKLPPIVRTDEAEYLKGEGKL